MSTKAPPMIDLWLDDDELAELANSLERIVNRSQPAPATRATTFYGEYYEVE